MKIEQISNQNIIFMRRTGPYGKENAKLMGFFKEWIEENHLLNENSIIYGIARDNPFIVESKDCRYDVCLVGDYLDIRDSNIRNGIIEGGKYTIFQVNHTAEGIQDAWNGIFKEIEKEGYLLDESRSVLERYTSEMIRNHYCEMCIPIV